MCRNVVTIVAQIANVRLRELRLRGTEMEPSVAPVIRTNAWLRCLALTKCHVGGAEGMRVRSDQVRCDVR